MQKIVKSIKANGRALLLQLKKSNSSFFFSLLLFFVVSNLMFQFGWKPKPLEIVWKIYYVLFTAIMWGSAIYLFYVFAEWRAAWKHTGALVLIGLFVFIITAIISKYETTDSYKFIMGVFFCLTICGKRYDKILKNYLVLFSASLLLAFILMLLGITYDAAKPERAYGGHSLGILYPNDWGYLMFAVMILFWYLSLRGKKVITILFFAVTAIFMYKYITCMTIALLSILFPLAAILSEMLEDKAQKADAVVPPKWYKVVEVFFIILPFLFLTFMLFFCWQMDWVHDTFYGTKLHTFAMRFVEGGYALKLVPLKLFGRPFEQMQTGVIDYLNEIDMKIDSAYLTYIIIRGIIPMGMTLGWISLAHKRCLRMRDYRLLCISVFMLIFSMMERPGLDVWYNFVLLYPLAGLQDDTADHFGMAITASV